MFGWHKQKRALTQVSQETILYTKKVGKETDVFPGERIVLFPVAEE